MGCLRALGNDFLRLVSLTYLAAGTGLIWGAAVLADFSRPRELVRIRAFWFPDALAVSGCLALLLGVVSTVGAWTKRALPTSWFAGASFVALAVQAGIALAFLDDREAFQQASKYDRTEGLAAALDWIKDNEALFLMALYVALTGQALAALVSTFNVVCCRPHHRGYRHRRDYMYVPRYGRDGQEFSPLLPQSYSPHPAHGTLSPSRQHQTSTRLHTSPPRPYMPPR